MTAARSVVTTDPSKRFSLSRLRSLLSWATLIILALLLLTGLLVYRNYRLKRQLAQIAAREVKTLHPGDRLISLRGRDAKANVIELGMIGEGRTLLIILAPSCPICERALPTLAEMVREQGQHVRVLALILAPEGQAKFDKYQAAFGPNAIIISDPPLDLLRHYGLDTAPQTLIVDSDGVVENVWKGNPQAAIPDIVRQLGNADANPAQPNCHTCSP